MMSPLQLATKYRDAGISVLPIRPDATKSPALYEWKHLQSRPADDAELSEMFRGNPGIAAIAGNVSGKLEVYDFDNAELFEPWSKLVREELGQEFFNRFVIVRTPRPGFHVYTRCAAVSGNMRLALRKIIDPDFPEAPKKIKALIETRGEGGYTLLPGCPGACHITGRSYELIQGTFHNIPEIHPEERDVLISCARSFNEVVIQEEDPREERRTVVEGLTPGNDFAIRASWVDILKPHGYKAAGMRRDVTLWTRPGKERGISATTNHAGSDLFYPFSTSCHPFNSERGYSKFAAFTLLNHNGDFREAARALAANGYGAKPIYAPPQRPAPETTTPEPVVDSSPASQIVEVLSLLSGIEQLHVTGLQRGKSSGWSSLDDWYTVRKRELTLITGHPNHGKSCWLDNMMVNLARSQEWRFGVFSAENLPLERYAATFMEIYTGKPFSKGPHARLTIPEVQKAAIWVHEHFKFMNPQMEKRRIENLLQVSEFLVSKHNVDALVIDPWNELDHIRQPGIREDEYISVALSKIRHFARNANVHFFIVAHPAKSYRDSSGKHPVPTMFDVKGASEWNAKTDNGICVWRDMLNPENGTDIHIQKVRFREVGKAGGGCNLKYDAVSGRFIDPNHKPTIDELEKRMNQPYVLREPGDES